MEEWKLELLNKYELEEIVPDNVFIYRFVPLVLKPFKNVLFDLGMHYQILSIAQNPLATTFLRISYLIVVGKKQE